MCLLHYKRDEITKKIKFCLLMKWQQSDSLVYEIIIMDQDHFKRDQEIAEIKFNELIL